MVEGVNQQEMTLKAPNDSLHTLGYDVGLAGFRYLGNSIKRSKSTVQEQMC